MLVTFHSKAWSSIIMTRDIAVTLLKMAGHSGTVPSAMLAADIPAALTRLNQGLAAADPDDAAQKHAARAAPRRHPAARIPADPDAHRCSCPRLRGHLGRRRPGDLMPRG